MATRNSESKVITEQEVWVSCCAVNVFKEELGKTVRVDHSEEHELVVQNLSQVRASSIRVPVAIIFRELVTIAVA